MVNFKCYTSQSITFHITCDITFYLLQCLLNPLVFGSASLVLEHCCQLAALAHQYAGPLRHGFIPGVGGVGDGLPVHSLLKPFVFGSGSRDFVHVFQLFMFAHQYAGPSKQGWLPRFP